MLSTTYWKMSRFHLNRWGWNKRQWMTTVKALVVWSNEGKLGRRNLLKSKLWLWQKHEFFHLFSLRPTAILQQPQQHHVPKDVQIFLLQVRPNSTIRSPHMLCNPTPQRNTESCRTRPSCCVHSSEHQGSSWALLVNHNQFVTQDPLSPYSSSKAVLATDLNDSYTLPKRITTEDSGVHKKAKASWLTVEQKSHAVRWSPGIKVSDLWPQTQAIRYGGEECVGGHG